MRSWPSLGCGYKIHDIPVTVKCTLLLCRKRHLSTVSAFTDTSNAKKENAIKCSFNYSMLILDFLYVVSKYFGLYFLPVRALFSTTEEYIFFVFHCPANKLHQLTTKLLRKFILIIFFMVIFIGFSLLEVFSKRFLYLENKTMKMKNRNKVDTLAASCKYYTMLIDYRNQY